VLREYVGAYDAAPEMTIVVTLEDGRLNAHPTNQQKLPLFPESREKFFLRAVNIQITFVRNDAGQVTGLVVHEGGRDTPARKVR
jgi:hypothetical protein